MNCSNPKKAISKHKPKKKCIQLSRDWNKNKQLFYNDNIFWFIKGNLRSVYLKYLTKSDVLVEEHSGQLEEEEALLNKDLSQTLEERAESTNVDPSTIFRRLPVIGMIYKQGNWILYQLKRRDTEKLKWCMNCCFKHNGNFPFVS